MVKKINAAEFDELLKGDKVVVCDFFATWCGPCRMLAPVLEEVSEEVSEKAVFVKIDVDECGELAKRYSIMNIPFVCVFSKGELKDKFVGYISKVEAKEFFDKTL